MSHSDPGADIFSSISKALCANEVPPVKPTANNARVAGITLNFSANINAEATENRVYSAGAGLCALLIGIALLLAMQSGSWLGQWINWSQSDEQRFNSPKSAVLPLVSLSPAQRTVQLQAIAQLPKSQDRVRARYLLASDLIEQQQGKGTRAMDGLEQNYSVLAPHCPQTRSSLRSNQGQSKAQLAWE